MADEPLLAIITLSYISLHKKNEHWGNQCEPVVICEGSEFIRIYSPNNNGISDSTGMKYDDTFKHMIAANTGILSVNDSC